ncbi:CBS domain and cyclic nucleotide-regulated nucleotidyltransferase [Nitritalea halalkaliphila LW7]|uniref:CBS domain and cyclic nucleotide-regulated nucleotidyltransferase n=2 Tax=Nitritalea TaxID=1187887 RepID=I5C5V3_9BACT|nr:CBS domain and cyclic nucleotide-regulated nucleotidyltransferase [Nitritalea halalkaliphila LW7]
MALIGKRPYTLQAEVQESSLVYALPVAYFEQLLEENSRVALYFAAGFASGQVVVRRDLSQAQVARSTFKEASNDTGLYIFTGKSSFSYTREVLTCTAETSIREAAARMTAADVSSIVIANEHGLPVGILTDKDLRRRVVAASLSPDLPIAKAMTTPVMTLKTGSSFSEVYLTMLKHRLHHLIFTADGTAESPIAGLVSDHDILLAQGNSPAVLIHALMNTFDVSEMAKIREQAEKLLRYYLENEVAIDFVTNIISEINDVILKRGIQIVQKNLREDFPGMEDIRFAFLSLGSEGREEQLLRTDLDNALVYDLPAGKTEEEVQPYFLALAEQLIAILERCGFQRCPADMMASNPQWCVSLAKWKGYFSRWISSPSQKAVMHATIFFDFRLVYGSKELSRQLSEHIFSEIKANGLFMNFLAKNALLNPPPLGFFRNFIVEKSGEHQDKFDIKLRAMMPLADAARTLVLQHHVIGINNTFKRFEKLAQLEPKHAETYREAGKAYEILIRMRALNGLANASSGRYLAPSSLGKLQRQLLKNTFAPIEEVQKILKVRFQTDYFNG